MPSCRSVTPNTPSTKMRADMTDTRTKRRLSAGGLFAAIRMIGRLHHPNKKARIRKRAESGPIVATRCTGSSAKEIWIAGLSINSFLALTGEAAGEAATAFGGAEGN